MKADLEQTVAVFEKMAASGFDAAAPLKWGFFFMAKSTAELDTVWAELSGHQYTRESSHQAEDGTYVLQVSKVQPLTAEQLHRRNLAFNQLAEHCGQVLYDG